MGKHRRVGGNRTGGLFIFANTISRLARSVREAMSRYRRAVSTTTVQAALQSMGRRPAAQRRNESISTHRENDVLQMPATLEVTADYDVLDDASVQLARRKRYAQDREECFKLSYYCL